MPKPEIIGILGLFFLFIITAPFYFQSISMGGNSIGSDTNKVAVSAADTVADFLFSKLQAGTGITLAIQNPGGDENILISASGSGTDTNCSDNPLCVITGRINSGFDGNFQLDLNVGNTLSVHGDINMDRNMALRFDNDWNISTNGSDIEFRKINATGIFDVNNSNAQFNNLGLANNPPVGTVIINTGSGTTGARNILFGNLTYIQTSSPRGIDFGMDFNGLTNTVDAIGARLYSRDERNTNAVGISNYIGVLSETGLNPLTNIRHTQGQHFYTGFESIINGSDSNTFVTGGSYVARGIWQRLIGDFNNFGKLFGAVFNNDVQINTDVNLYLDGIDDGNKGDTLFVHPSDSNNLILTVDGNKNTTFDNNANEFHVRSVFRKDINATNIYPDGNNTGQLGRSTTKWADIWGVNIHTGDLIFSNGLFIREPDPDTVCLYHSDGNVLNCFNNTSQTNYVPVIQKQPVGVQPSCNSTNEGMTWFTKGLLGVATKYEMCVQTVLNVYIWTPLI